MTLTILDSIMTSDHHFHTARQAPDGRGWAVSWLPGKVLDRNAAITAMTLADIAAVPDLNPGHRLWPHVEGWAAELGLTGPMPSPGPPSRPPTPATRRSQPAGSPTVRQPIDQHEPASRPAGLACITMGQRACISAQHRVTDAEDR